MTFWKKQTYRDKNSLVGVDWKWRKRFDNKEA